MGGVLHLSELWLNFM